MLIAYQNVTSLMGVFCRILNEWLKVCVPNRCTVELDRTELPEGCHVTQIAEAACTFLSVPLLKTNSDLTMNNNFNKDTTGQGHLKMTHNINR